MPEEYSDEFSEDDTPLSAIKVIKTKKMAKSPRIQSAFSKKSPIKRTAQESKFSVGKRRRPVSAPVAKPAKREAVVNWMKSMKNSGRGLSTESSANALSNLNRNQLADASFRSIPHYLRRETLPTSSQQLGSAPAAPHATPHATPGARTAKKISEYKTQEDYYDEVQALKKNVTVTQLENSVLRSKLRRLEGTSSKTSKDLMSLLDNKTPPGIQNSQQKIVKLEQQLREKDKAMSALQESVKFTDINEMRIQVEALFAQVQRLKINSTVAIRPKPALQAKAVPASDGKNETSLAKMKALKETILRINEQNIALTSENSSLKTDLERFLEKSKDHIARNLKKEKVEPVEKIDKLTSNVAEKMKQLDERSESLQTELTKVKQVLKRTKDDRNAYRLKYENERKENEKLNLDLEELQTEMHRNRDSSSKRLNNRPSRVASDVEYSDENTAFIQAALRGHMTRSRRIADDDAIVRLQSIARGHLTRRAVPRRGHDVNRKSISVSPPPSQRRASHSADRDKMRRSLSRSPLRVEVSDSETNSDDSDFFVRGN